MSAVVFYRRPNVEKNVVLNLIWIYSLYSLGVMDFAPDEIELVVSINEYGEYIYDEFLKNMEERRYNRLLDIGKSKFICIYGLS